MFKKSERRNRRGFTLAEVLTVVAIIGILLAVAIPNVISYYRSLKLTELDDSAKTIFMAAQSRLTAMTAAGQDLTALGHKKAVAAHGVDVRVQAVTAADGDDLKALVLGGSIESQLHDNNYVVEIDPKTGAVYAVWYWEKDGDFAYADSNIGETPTRQFQLDNMVGYYGGPNIDRLDLEQTNFPPLQLTNAEELRLEITVPGKTVPGTQPEIYATVTLSDGGGKCVIIKEAKLDYTSGTDNLNKGVIVLDTLKVYGEYDTDGTSFFAHDMAKGMPFNRWTDLDASDGSSYTITPGADFDIEVKVEAVDATGGDKHYLPQYIYWTDVNSLFASVDGNTAHIAYGRHLQNLDTATSGVTNTITAAEQTQNIDFDDNGSGIQSWDDTYKDGATDGHTHQTFHAINNNNLTTYDGGKKTIKNLNVVEDEPNTVAGLFGSFGERTDNTISDVTLINAKVSGTGNTGALVGETTGSTITVNGCKVYLEGDAVPTPSAIEPYIKSTAGAVGGLIGSTEGTTITIKNSFASTVEQGGSEAVGGLLGLANGNTTISTSYAAGYLSGTTVGGLVGGALGTFAVDNSYAAGIIASATTTAAGISAQNNGTMTINNSYAAVRYVTSGITASNIYGLAPTGATGTEAYYVKQTGVNYTGYGTGVSMSKLKGMINDGTTFTSADGWYVPGTGTNVNPQGLTNPYNLLGDDLADPYPYPMLASSITAVGGTGTLPMPHYGDWLENSYATSFYWEKEKDSAGADKYHIYLVMSDGTTKYVADGLCSSHHLGTDEIPGTGIDAWGYGLIGIDAGTLTKYTGTDESLIIGELKTFAEDRDNYDTANSITDEALEDITALLTNADDNVILLEGSKSDNFQTIKTKVGYIEMNLGFAAAIDVTRDNGTAPVEATYMGKKAPTPAPADADRYIPYQIRTVQQLDNIPDGTGTGTARVPHTGCYEQTHDLYGGADKTTPAPYAGYTGANNFGGEYDGGGYRILELKIDNSTGNGERGGMFSILVGAKLRNIILYSPSGKAEINSAVGHSVGALALSSEFNNTTIENCAVAGYTIKANNGMSTGGLVGVLVRGSLTIKNCSSVNTLGATGTTSFVGGLVGEVRNSVASLIIEDSYAGGTIINAGASIKGVGGILGGFDEVGASAGYTRVYSYVDMTDPSVQATTVYGIGPGTVTAGSTARYWSGGIPSGVTVSDTGNTAASLSDLTMATPTTQHTYIPDTDTSHSDEERFKNGLTESPVDYPFTLVVTANGDLVHYGDWPDEPAAQSLCYYEGYPLTGGSIDYKLWGYIDPTDTTPVNNLQQGDLTDSDLEYAVEDGYCVLVEKGKSEPEVKVDGFTGTITLNQISGASYTDGSGKDYDLYKINGLDGVDKTKYYNKITVGDADYWFNPFFACEIQTTKPSNMNTPGAKEGAAGQGVSGNYDGQVVIRTARQLVWLGELTKGVDKDGNAKSNPYFSTPDDNLYFYYTYNQLLDINYDDYNGDYESTFNGLSNANGDLQQPINLMSRSSNTGKYIGRIIKNLKMDIPATSANFNAGLFGVVKGEVSGVHLVDATVKTSVNDSDVSIGGLIGETMGSAPKVTDCGIYLDTGVYDNCVVEATGEGDVGGLIGNIGQGTEVTNCFAAVKVKGTENVGGFAGLTKSDVTISDCYSGGHTVSGTYNASDANVTSSSGNAGGLIGQLGRTNTFKGVCYSTCSVSGNNVGQLIGKTGTSSAPTTTGATLYATGTTSGSYDSDVKRWEDANLTDYTANLADILAATNKKTNASASVYDKDTLGNTYPYLPITYTDNAGNTITMTHHGDWPELQEAVFYWEQEGTGTDIATKQSGAYSGEGYHFYAKGYLNNQEVTLDTLCTEHHTVEETLNTNTISYTNWGYGLYGKTAAQAPTIPADVQQTTNTYAVAGFKKLLSLDSTGVSVNLLKGRPSIGSSPSSTSTSVTHNYKFNVNFGAAIEVDTSGTSTMGTSGNPYKIRNVKQLDNIPGSASYEYEQTHDLDGSSTPSYNGPSAFAGTYDGRSYRILEISDIGGSGIMTNYALFVSLSNGATLRNIILYSPSGKGAFSAESASSWGAAPVVGGLVGSCENTGTGTISITNCVVAGYNLSFPDGGVGALVGRVKAGVTLNIDRCEAVNTITASTAQGVGGLVGNVEGTVNITNSYAGGKIILSTAGGTSNLSDAGGLVGKIGTTGSCTYTNVYAYMDMTDTGLNITGSVYGIGPGGTSGTYDNCHYWSGGLNGQPAADNGQSGITEETNVADLADCMSGAKDIGGNLIFSTSTDTVASYPTTSTGAPTGNYPYPAVVREVDEDGNPTNVFVHYGDWPT